MVELTVLMCCIINIGDGVFYALHIRRGDFQFKEVKISAAQIVDNLRFPENGE